MQEDDGLSTSGDPKWYRSFVTKSIGDRLDRQIVVRQTVVIHVTKPNPRPRACVGA